MQHKAFQDQALPFPPRFEGEQPANRDQKLGEIWGGTFPNRSLNVTIGAAAAWFTASRSTVGGPPTILALRLRFELTALETIHPLRGSRDLGGSNYSAEPLKDKADDPPEPETKTAAQAGPLNGGISECESTSLAENAYHGETSAATRAGIWFAENRETCPRPIVPTLKAMFGLSALEVVEAFRVANGVRR